MSSVAVLNIMSVLLQTLKGEYSGSCQLMIGMTNLGVPNPTLCAFVQSLAVTISVGSAIFKIGICLST